MPEIEEREASRYGGYTWREWLTLARRERITGVAYFRVRRLIEMHQQTARDKEHERRIRQAEAKRH